MFLSRAFGQCAHIKPRYSTLAIQRLPSSLLRGRPLTGLSSIPRKPLETTSYQPRWQSTEGYAKVKNDALRYPENLNIFNSGAPPTVALGLLRVVCTVVFAYGILWAAPSFVLDPAAPTYLAPVIAIGAAVPLLVTGLAFGGYVHHINILLPTTARRSKDYLMAFAEAVPPSTIVQVKCMWFRPWPVTKEIYFSDLRRLPRSWSRLANLEHAPSVNRNFEEKNPMWSWVVSTFMGRYFVSRSQIKDRSRAPGVWGRVWEQIPMVGDEEKIKAARKVVVPVERRPVMAANRAPLATVPKNSSPTKRKTKR